jgi:hypothetical protein
MSGTVHETQFLLFLGKKVKTKLKVNGFSSLEDFRLVSQICQTTPQKYTHDFPHLY